MSFKAFFQKATSGREPYPYQERFATSDELPLLLNAPTGAGKTATAILGWLWRLRNRDHTPRRLIYCLPMRVLVEQTERETREWVAALQLNIPVHVLMGGVDSEKWFLDPHQPAVLIGTQDMLLSRALNRGYAASRFHWPIDFGLLNNDCLWVFDEPQLMANGVSTSAQLAGLRTNFPTYGSCPSLWMSATLEPDWLNTIDFRGKFDTVPMELSDQDYDPKRPLYKRMTAAKTLARFEVASSKDMKDVAKAAWDKHEDGTQTLVIVNTVDRAKAVYGELSKLCKKPDACKLLLVHSRFRPRERSERNELLKKGDESKNRIIVATQVVEAGVDISARTLITELCPWASMVQRIGRCNRAGDDGTSSNPARVWWIDLDEKQAPPYEPSDLAFSREQLAKLDQADVSPKALGDFKRVNGIKLPFEHKHVLRRRDLLDLFDTAPDLSGNDIDISRFVRSDDDSVDVQVFWRQEAPSNDWDAVESRRQAARREELCHVPLKSFREDFLQEEKEAYRFDYLDGKWMMITKRDKNSVVPGQQFWITADQGGYDKLLGWKPDVPHLAADVVIPPPDTVSKSWWERPDGFYDSDEWAQQSEWRTLAEHTQEVVDSLNEILNDLPVEMVSEFERDVLRVTARWHDWGKAHDIFQSGLRSEIDDPNKRTENLKLPKELRAKSRRPARWINCPDIAKAPQEFWQKYRRVMSDNRSTLVKRFRHELASALGVLALWNNNRLPKDWTHLSELGRWLALYLIASHHGKVRLSIRAMPDERPVPDRGDEFASGIWKGDQLPTSDLGGDIHANSVELSLDAMKLGGPMSWTSHALDLRDELGPFRLSFLEGLIRAADCRASKGTSMEGDDDV